MKKLKMIFVATALISVGSALFAQSNANDTQAAIVNSLLIQQLMQMQQQQNQQQAQQPPAQAPAQAPAAEAAQEQATVKKRAIETEDDLLENGYKRFKIAEDAEDNIVIKNKGNDEYEIEIWAVSSRNRLGYYGTILVTGKKGYKGNPLDGDLDNYKSVWLKITNDENAIIKNLGERFSDQYFEIQQ